MLPKHGKLQFMHDHKGVQGVAFNPNARYIFCSGGTDGQIHVYSALHGGPVSVINPRSPNAIKKINAVKFTADGSRILATTARRLTIIDVEAGKAVFQYTDCSYSGRERSALATDPNNSNIAICTSSDGTGLTTLDLRKKDPVHFAPNRHKTVIRDIIFMDESWPYAGSGVQTIASVSLDGHCNIRTLDDRHVFDFCVGHIANCLTATPDFISGNHEDGFASMIMIGGSKLTGYMPGSPTGNGQILTYGDESFGCDVHIQKIKYTSNGHYLFTASSDGLVCRYRRVGDDYHIMNEVYSHNREIVDMDICPTDEFLVTASRGGDVGVLRLGLASHGWTGFMQKA